jgi:hypothetical protein
VDIAGGNESIQRKVVTVFVTTSASAWCNATELKIASMVFSWGTI